MERTITKTRFPASFERVLSRIKHYPGVTLDVVLSSSGRNGPTTSSRNTETTIPSTESNDIEGLNISHPLPDTSSHDDNVSALPSASTFPPQKLSNLEEDSNTTLSFEQIMVLPQKKALESEVEQKFVPSLPSDAQAQQVRASANNHDSPVQIIRDGLLTRLDEQLVACLQELNNKMIENNGLASRIMDLVIKNNELVSKNNELANRVIKLQEAFDTKQDEMKQLQLQLQASDLLVLLQSRVQALLTQTYELYEYPIPRLFIVLPQDSSSWNPLDLLSNKLRLYFLCECGEHTRSINSRTPHHIHLAKHEGYDIARPKEFFQQYGSYVLTVLQMLKFGISVAGVAIPVVPLLAREDATDETNLKMLVVNLQSRMDQAIGYIEKVSAECKVADRPAVQLRNEALEGADVRQLETFLKNKDKNRVLGNLYRTVTSEGHVKWVCFDHYRESNQGKEAKALRDVTESLKGSFDESIGRVEVRLLSRLQAEEFYLALEKATSIYELKITHTWDTTQSDFKKLRDTLAKTNMGVLDLDLNNTDGPTSDISNHNQRYDPVFDIMRHPSIRSVTIDRAKDFVKRSSLKSHNHEFRNLRHLDLSVSWFQDDISGFRCLVTKAPNISSLTLRRDAGFFLRFYNAIAEHQTYPIAFPDRALRILPPKNKPLRSIPDIKDMTGFLRDFGERIEILSLPGRHLEEPTIAALAKATENGSELKELTLQEARRNLGEKCVKDLADIVARSELRKLDIHLGHEKQRMKILESVQWSHISSLAIGMDERDLGIGPLRTLVYGIEKLSGSVQVEQFELYYATPRRDMTMEHEGLLRSFFALTSLKHLQLDVFLTTERVVSLMESLDFSRLQYLFLWCEGFNSTEVEAIMGKLQHATELRTVILWKAKMLDGQRERMKAKGATLKNAWL